MKLYGWVDQFVETMGACPESLLAVADSQTRARELLYRGWLERNGFTQEYERLRDFLWATTPNLIVDVVGMPEGCVWLWYD